MQDLLGNPAVQGGVAPFVVALAAACALFAVRLAGLAIAAALGTAVYLIGGFAFPPASAQQKILLISLAVPLLGIFVDLAFKPTRAAGPVLGLIFGMLVIWVGWNVLMQKEIAAMLAAGAAVALLVGWVTASCFALRDDPVRAGAAALALGLGVGISAVLSASGSYGQYGVSVGAGAGAFLLVQCCWAGDTGGRHIHFERRGRLRPARRGRLPWRAIALVRGCRAGAGAARDAATIAEGRNLAAGDCRFSVRRPGCRCGLFAVLARGATAPGHLIRTEKEKQE